MSLTVPENVLMDSIRCPNNYSCLDSGQSLDRPICKVDYSLGNNLLFISPLNEDACPYRVAVGTSNICKCPTHFFLNSNY